MSNVTAALSTERRLKVEQMLLNRYFSDFRISEGAVRGTLTSNSGVTYGVRIELGCFPLGMPRAYITSPVLKSHSGVPLRAYQASAALHVLQADAFGNPQVCHWNPAHWTPEHTLYMVVMKVRLWLEAYEAHVRTGLPLDHYLSHA